MEKNFYDMTNVNGKAVKDAKRIQAQTAEYLARHNAKLQEALQSEEDAKMNAAMSGARFGYAATVARSNARINKLSEEIRYTNKSSVIGMTEMVAQVVEEGLLLDEGELVKICPEYKEEIRGIIKGFLEEGELNSVITNEKTLSLMEYVSKKLPSAREGVSLTEDELANYIAANRPVNIDRTLKNLGGDVAARVATLMEKEQKKAEQIENDVKRVTAPQQKDVKEAATSEELVNAIAEGQLSVEALDEMLKNGEITQDTYDEVIQVLNQEQPVEESTEEQPVEEAPVEDMGAAAQDQQVVAMPKKQVQMLPDGTMNINIYENRLVHETPRCGLIESLAVNEAQTMLKEGKSYDGDLCLAKAIMYVTITEAMDELGLMNADSKKYAQIISAAGGNLTEKSTHIDYAGMRKLQSGVKNPNKINKKSPMVVTAPDGNVTYRSGNGKEISKQQYDMEKSKFEKLCLSESVLVSQYVPVRNDIKNGDSIAERIRQKRLNNQKNLNE